MLFVYVKKFNTLRDLIHFLEENGEAIGRINFERLTKTDSRGSMNLWFDSSEDYTSEATRVNC